MAAIEPQLEKLNLNDQKDNAPTLASDTYSLRKALCAQLYELCLKPNDTFKFETNFLQIWELLEKLNELESEIPFCAPTERTSEHFDKLMSHLKTNGKNETLVNQNVSIEKQSNEAYYGVKAKKEFKAGDLVFQIPNELILSVNNALDSELRELILNDKLLFIMPHIALAIYILYLKLSLNSGTAAPSSEAEKWRFYLDILPSQFHTPLYFTLNEIKSLQHAQCFYDILFHIRNIARQYAYLFKLFDSQKSYDILKKNFSFRNYKWCVSVVSTRQNQILDEKKNKVLAMIPLLDMCNHQDGETCTDYDEGSHSARCFANRDIKPGDQITIFYGRRNNRDSLIHNGFVCEKNRYNSFLLKLGVAVKDPLFNERSEVLGEFGLSATESFEIKESLENENQVIIPPETYIFVKIFLIKNVEELVEIHKLKHKNVEKYFKKNNLASNSEIKQFLKIRLTVLLRSYAKQETKAPETTNELFIKHLLDSEIRLIQTALNNLG